MNVSKLKREKLSIKIYKLNSYFEFIFLDLIYIKQFLF